MATSEQFYLIQKKQIAMCRADIIRLAEEMDRDRSRAIEIAKQIHSHCLQIQIAATYITFQGGEL